MYCNQSEICLEVSSELWISVLGVTKLFFSDNLVYQQMSHNVSEMNFL